MSKVIGIDLGTTNSVVAVMEGWGAGGHRQPGRRPHHAVGRGLLEGRPSGRPGRQAAGRHQPREHRVLDQALHGPQAGRGRVGDQPRAVPGRRERQRRCVGRGARQEVLAARNLRDDSPEAEDRGRGLSRREGHRRRDHGAGLLQRRAASGHQGRGQDRRAERPAHRQRADRGGAGLRPRQEEGREDRGLRLRRRHLRHLGARGGRGRRRGEGHQRRHAPRR